MKPSLKKNILVALVSVAGFLLLAALGFYLYFILQFDVYRDEVYKFSIKYPKTWKVVIHPQPNVAVGFLRPKDTALDTLQENFNVTVQPVPEVDSTLLSFSAAIKRQMSAVFGKSITFVLDKPLSLGWRKGHQMALITPAPNRLEMVNGWVLREGKAYIMTFLGDANKYDKDKLFVYEMLHSLRVD